MGKLLQLLVLGAIAWFVYRVLAGRPGLPRQDDTSTTGGRPSPGGGIMRRCAYCQVHVPEGESSQSRGHFFCSEAHRDAFFRERG